MLQREPRGRTEHLKLQDFTFGMIAISSLFLLFNASGTNATTSPVDSVSVEVPVACTMTSTEDTAHTATANVGTYQENIGETTFNVICNDANGFSVYAVGYTNDEFGNTTMKPSIIADTNAIATGTATSGNISNWAMKLTAVTGDYAPTLETGFNAYHAVPAEYTKVVSYSSNTDSSSGSSFKSTYAAFITSAQPADTYTGKVKYTVVHPANELPQIESISQLTYMQDFENLTSAQKTTIINSMSYNTTYNLIDSRDNKTYKIAKLKDGNIWMAENLDLGRTALTEDLTSTNTNLDAETVTIATSTFNSWIRQTTARSFTSAEVIPVTGTDSTSNTPYGTIYNYCAASAGTICSDSNANNNDATSDLCPAGWRLPTGGDIGEIKTLYNLTDYNTYTKMRAPIASGGAAFALAGSFDYSSPYGLGSVGYYWSSTMYDGTNMHNLKLDTSSINPTSYSLRRYGGTVRCVAKGPSYTITTSYGSGISSIKVDGRTVQNGSSISLEKKPYQIIATPNPGYGFSSWSTTSEQVNITNTQATIYTLNENTTISATASYINTEMQNLSQDNCTTIASQVRDIRDNHVYTIQRLADGNCWMMDNLDLGRTALTTDLTSSNTNITNTIATSTFNSWKKASGSKSFTDAEYISTDGADLISGTPYGTLYNFCAVSAGTICTSSNNNDATSDLCPAGWRLPTGGSSGEFTALYNLTDYNSITKMRAPVTDGGAAFALAGYFGNSTPNSFNLSGSYWSSTKNKSISTGERYSISFNPNKVLLVCTGDGNNGRSARCVLKN